MDLVSYVLAYGKAKGYTDQQIQSLSKGLDYKGSVSTVADLPTASSSNKGWMYTISSNGHEYVSDGTQWIDLSADLDNKETLFRFSTMPTASASNLGNIVEYIGVTDSNYTNGYFYKCVLNNNVYSWEAVNVQKCELTNNAKIALMNCFSNVAWANANGLTNYNALLNALDIQPSLPIAYQKVSYIGSNNNSSYIDTDYYANNNTVVKTKIERDDGNSYFGYGSGYDTNKFNITGGDSLNITCRWGVLANTPTLQQKLNEIEFGKEIKINGTLIHTFGTQEFTTTHTIALLGRKVASGSVDDCTIGKIYYFKVYENNTLVKNYVPCYRKSDNAIGVYETIGGNFFAGTGTLTKGDDVI